MRVKAVIHLLAKVSKTWKDKEGVSHPAYSANIMQNNGEIIDTIRLNADQYNAVEAGKVYTISADYANGRNGAYLNIVDIAEGNK